MLKHFALLPLLASAALAQEAPPQPPTDPDFPAARVELGKGADEVPGNFLDAGTEWITFGLGGGAGNNDVNNGHVFASWSTFLDDGVEFIVEGAGHYFEQPDKDAAGGTLSALFRWHWWYSEHGEQEEPRWTSYLDIGIGLMGTTDDVPEEGTSFNFSPRVGAGVTRLINEDWRLNAGVRWLHVSNGRIWGEDDNPAVDGAVLYLGFTRRF